MQARMECEMTGGVIRAALRAPPLLLPPRMKVVFGAAADGSSIFTTARGFTQPLATAAPPNKTHHEQRLCLDPHCNVFHMCPPPPASPPSPASHSHVSPILPPSCQCHPFSLLLATYSPLEKIKKRLQNSISPFAVRRPCKGENYKQGERSESERRS